MIEVQIPAGKKAYFASDFHLGFPNNAESLAREKYIISWLSQVQKDASDVFLLGDLFDFWFEYSQVVPKGFVRFLGKLAEMNDAGIQIHIFVGNHDLWMRSYLKDEMGAIIYNKPTEFSFDIQGKSVKALLGHGDGLGPGDYGYKFLKQIFINPILPLIHFIINSRNTTTFECSSIVHIFEYHFKKNKPLPVVYPGTQKRKFTHISDTVQACYFAWKRKTGLHYSIANNKSYSIGSTSVIPSA